MENQRVSSGITKLDTNLQGGFPSGSVISLFGKTGKARTKMALNFIANGSGNLYITTKNQLDHINIQANQHGVHLDTVLFLDAVHWRVKRVKPKLETNAKYKVSNLTDLNALLAKIMEACNDQEISKILFDSPTSLLLYSTPGKEQVFKFFELLTAYTRSNQITMCYTLEDGVHNSNIVATMHYLSDGVLHFKDHLVNIDHMSLTQFPNDSISITD